MELQGTPILIRFNRGFQSEPSILGFGAFLGLLEVNHDRSCSEAASLHRDIKQTNGKPDSANRFRQRIKIPPDQAAKGETEQREQGITQQISLGIASADYAELPKRREIHSHESEERAEIEQFAGVFVCVTHMVEPDRAKEGENANNQNVVNRRAAARREIAKYSARKDVVASHAEQQAGGSQAASEAAAECGENQNRSHSVEQNWATNAAADVHERGLEVGKGMPVGPHSLAQVNFEATEDPRKYADQDRRQQDVSFWILHVFSQGRHAIKTNVG